MPTSPASEGGGGVEHRRPGEPQTEPQVQAQAPQETQQPPQPQAAEGAPAGEAPPDGDAATKVDELEARNAELQDRYLRALADLDNYRKRAARDTERRIVESREAVLRDWLLPLDSLERALRMEPPDSPALSGLRAVLEQMEALLERYGVARVGTVGERFDPQRHEAVGVHSTDDVPDHSIVDVARSGFALGDRVLRPAEVIVARHEEPAA